MRIGIDAIHLSSSGKGLCRFERCLVSTVAAGEWAHSFTIFVNRNVPEALLPRSSHVEYVRASPTNALVWEQLQLPRLVEQRGLDCTVSQSDRLPLTGGKRYVLYLFEIPDHRMRDAKARTSKYEQASNAITKLLFPRSLRRADPVVAASLATRRDLRNHYGMPDVPVIYPAPSQEFRPALSPVHLQESRAAVGAPEGYVLHFSSANDPRDNTPTALRAFHHSMVQLGHSKKLVIPGNCDPVLQGLAPLVEQLGLADRLVLPGFVPESRLVDLYQAADVYLDPSLYEGFGFQVLEAMACGTPVVCSNVTSLPEVAGGAGMLLPPNDSIAFGEALIQILSRPEKAASLRAAGLAKAAEFSWPRTARKIVEICERTAA